METVECVVAGGGAIGLAIARALVLRGREVLVIERNGDFGLETSGRNSEVIHAGIYYPPGSLKARLCRQGREMLVGYLAQNALPHRICGKLIVATSTEQERKLAAIEANALANGVTSLQRLDRGRVRELEPELASEGGLFSPATGIFDSRAYLRALLADIEAGGGSIAFRTIVLSVQARQEGYVVETLDAGGERYALRCIAFINAAGLWASELGNRIEATSSWKVPKTRYARGTYYGVEGKSIFRHLIYPLPEPGGLGVHLTLDLEGTMRFGPDVEWIDSVDYSLVEHRREQFRKAISRYWPAVAERELHPLYCGVRPKLARQGDPDADFLIAGPETHGMKGLVQLFGIESPGLTSSLAIAEHAVRLAGLS
jgi:L-2-hydroxyglutarate oxidase LhgO